MLRRTEIPKLLTSSILAACLCLVLAHRAGASPSIAWSGVMDIGLAWSQEFNIDLDMNGSSDFMIRHMFSNTDAFALTEGNEFLCTINEDPKYRPAARPEWSGILADDVLVDPHVWHDNPEDHRQIMMASGYGYWASADHAYMGVRFLGDAGLYYGWIEMSLDGSAPYDMTIHSWAYETQPGVGITIGMVPEPSTWALVLLGCAMFFLNRGYSRQS